jgi:4'-phosphopantetheinyl transferase
LRTIYPVILPVSDTNGNLKGRAKVAYLSGYARCALEISCRKSGIFLSRILKNENGSPLPFEGNFWSLTHKSKYVGAVAAPAGIGMDIEEIRYCSTPLFRKVADDREWNLVDADPDKLFFRYWTSKESVLKASGRGLGDLSKCRIAEVIDETMLTIRYRRKNFLIAHCYFDGHIASVVKNEFNIQWTFPKSPAYESSLL